MKSREIIRYLRHEALCARGTDLEKLFLIAADRLEILACYEDAGIEPEQIPTYRGWIPASMPPHTPTVDAVEVVRCRDCKHRGTDYCIFHIKGEPADEELLRKLDNDFCSYGERKEGRY